MNTGLRNGEDRSAEELQRDIRQHRSSLDETLSALQHKFSPGEMLDEGLRYLKTGPGEFAGNLAHAAKNNPLPLLLTGVGLAWLMLGNKDSGGNRGTQPAGTHARDDVASGEAAQREADLAAVYGAYLREEYPFTDEEIEYLIYEDLGPDYVTVRSAQGAQAAQDSDTGDAQGRVRESVSRAGDKASAAVDRVKTRARETQDEVRARMDAARESMSRATEDVKQRVAHARHVAARRVREGRRAAIETGRVAAQRGRELIDRYPLSLMAMGVAVGAILGTALPETRRENALMGEASDNLKDQAKARFEEEKARATRMADAARDAVADEAESQQLTADGLKSRADDVADRAKRVADAARDEAERQNLTGQAVREELHDTKEQVKKVAKAAKDAAADEARRS